MKIRINEATIKSGLSWETLVEGESAEKLEIDTDDSAFTFTYVHVNAKYRSHVENLDETVASIKTDLGEFQPPNLFDKLCSAYS